MCVRQMGMRTSSERAGGIEFGNAAKTSNHWKVAEYS